MHDDIHYEIDKTAYISMMGALKYTNVTLELNEVLQDLKKSHWSP